MDINDFTLGNLKELTNLLGIKPETKETPFEIGGKYFIRTVTHAHTGQIKSISGQFITLEKAAWIANTGRFSDALKNTNFDEVEPFSNDLILNVESIVDATKIDGQLPESQS